MSNPGEGYDHGPGAKRLIYWYVSAEHDGTTLPEGVKGAWVKKEENVGWTGLAVKSTSVSASPVHMDVDHEDWSPWNTYLERIHAPLYRWFVGAHSNACFQNVDKHLLERRGSEVAYSFIPEEGDPAWPAGVQHITRRQLAIEVAHAAKVLTTKHNLSQTSRVLFHMPTSVEQMVWVLACQRIGAMYTCTSVEHPVDSLVYRQRDVQPDLFICGDSSCQHGGREVFCDATLKKITQSKYILEVPCGGTYKSERQEYRELDDMELLVRLHAESPVVPVPATHPLFVSYTSGSTGKPKGVVHVHGGYMYGVALTMETVFEIPAGQPSGEVMLTIGTTGWITGQSYMVAGPLVSGTRGVLLGGSPVYPHLLRFAKAIEQEKVTIFKTGSALVRQLVSSQAAGKLKRIDLTTLRWGTFCAEPVSLDAQEFAVRHLCKNFMNSFSRPLEKRIKPDTESYALPWIEANIDPPTQELGDIAIRQPYPYLIYTVFGDVEHYGTPEWMGDVDRLKSTYWPNGFFLQGDNARVHDDGGFSFHGRSDEVINVNGMRIGTEEIEAQLWAVSNEHPDLACGGVAVVGAPDHIKGTTPVAFVVFKSGGADAAKGARLLEKASAALKKSIGTHAVPSAIFAFSTIPKTHTGKVARRTLQMLLSGTSNPDRSSLSNPASVDEVGAAVRRWQVGESNSSIRVDVVALFDKFGIKGHVVLQKAIMPGTGCISAVLEPFCTVAELKSVQFLKPLEKVSVAQVLKRGRQLTVTHDDVVLFKAEIGDGLDEAASDDVTKLVRTAFPSVPPRGQSWNDATDTRDKSTFYARCHKLQLMYTGDFVTVTRAEWRGLDFWADATARHLPAALDAALQVVCSLDHANTFIPFRVQRFRLLAQHDANGDKAVIHWDSAERVVCSGRVLSIVDSKMTAHVKVEVPSKGFVAVFLHAEFAKVGSLIVEEASPAATGGGVVTPDALRAMSENKRVTYVRGVIETAAQKIMSKNVDSAKSLDDNGMHSLDQVALITRVNETLQVNLSVKQWGEPDDTVLTHAKLISHALASDANPQPSDGNRWPLVDVASLEKIVDTQVGARNKGWVQWISNPHGPPRPGYWWRTSNAIIYCIRTGLWSKLRSIYRNGFLTFLMDPPTKVDLYARVSTKTKEVTVKRTDLNRHFTVREIIRASEDTFNLVLHKSGLAHLEHCFGRMYYASGIKARFIKEMPIHSYNRTQGWITNIRGPLVDVYRGIVP